jgi:hypothetical protein
MSVGFEFSIKKRKHGLSRLLNRCDMLSAATLTPESGAANGLSLPDFECIKPRERIMIFAPNRQKNVKTISSVDIDTDKELNHGLHLCIDQMCKHKDQRLSQKS